MFNNHAIQTKLSSAQRGVVLRIVSAYRTVSTSAVLVLASVPPIDFLTEERQETFQLRKELTCKTNHSAATTMYFRRVLEKVKMSISAAKF